MLPKDRLPTFLLIMCGKAGDVSKNRNDESRTNNRRSSSSLPRLDHFPRFLNDFALTLEFKHFNCLIKTDPPGLLHLMVMIIYIATAVFEQIEMHIFVISDWLPVPD